MNRNPEAAWYGLTWGQRRQVLKEAGKGRSHPDREIAEIARKWAKWRLGGGERNETKAAAQGLLATISDAAAGGVIGNLVAERRAAKKILKVNPPKGASGQ